MALTDSVCKNVKPKEKSFRVSDSGGLYLQVMPNGAKYWRLKYRFNKKEKLLAIGTYPFCSLAEAREEREKAKKLLKAFVDPVENKKQEKKERLLESTNTFKCIALDWLETKKEQWTDGHYTTLLNRLEKDIFPFIGNSEIAKIDAPELLSVLKKIENRGAFDLALRDRQLCGQIFRFAIQIGKGKENPAINLNGALKTRKRKHFVAIRSNEIPELIKGLNQNKARLYSRTRRAVMLSMLTFVRPGELRQASWDEIDLPNKVWKIPAERMKSRREHIVPLSSQAVTIILEQKEETGHLKTKYVFPSQFRFKEPMSEATVGHALKRLGFKDRMTAHGFRALARTTIREELNYDPDVIEAQLAHKPSGPLGAAYDRSLFIKHRQVMMQEWADYIDKVK